MEIINKCIKEIKPYSKNPRKNEAAIAPVAASIKEFGFKVPIIIDKDNVIVAGHTRLLAAKKLRLKEVPCIIADDLTNEQLRAFRLADNKTAEASEWDFGLLSNELGAIFDIDMSVFGFLGDLEEDAELEGVVLQPYEKVHYLISADINLHDEVLEHIKALERIGGVEIESTLN